MTSGITADSGMIEMMGLARSRSLSVRAALAASLSERYFGDRDGTDASERAALARVLPRLIHEVEEAARRVLTDHPLIRPTETSDMARVLGSDSADQVAALLCDPRRLAAEDLVAIVRHRPDSYRRFIAGRSTLPASVILELTAHGGEGVLLRLAANQEVRIPDEALARLRAHAERSPALTTLLDERALAGLDESGADEQDTIKLSQLSA